MSERPYPDISGLLAQKAEARRVRARRSYAEKLDVLDRLREAADRMKLIRESRSGPSTDQSKD